MSDQDFKLRMFFDPKEPTNLSVQWGKAIVGVGPDAERAYRDLLEKTARRVAAELERLRGPGSHAENLRSPMLAGSHDETLVRDAKEAEAYRAFFDGYGEHTKVRMWMDPVTSNQISPAETVNRLNRVADSLVRAEDKGIVTLAAQSLQRLIIKLMAERRGIRGGILTWWAHTFPTTAGPHGGGLSGIRTERVVGCEGFKYCDGAIKPWDGNETGGW